MQQRAEARADGATCIALLRAFDEMQRRCRATFLLHAACLWRACACGKATCASAAFREVAWQSASRRLYKLLCALGASVALPSTPPYVPDYLWHACVRASSHVGMRLSWRRLLVEST